MRPTIHFGGLTAVLRAAKPLLVLLAAPQVAHAEWYRREESIMTTRIYVELWLDDATAGERAIDAVMKSMHEVDDLMSTYKPDSQISRVNARAAIEPVAVDQELFDVIRAALEFSRITHGAFDISYASVGYLYDFRQHKRPTEKQIKAALPAVNWRHITLDPAKRTVKFERPGMRIDLGGIAKGYSVDRAIRILQSLGVKNAEVTAGGDSRMLGDHRGRPWIVAIRHPDDPNKVVTRLPLEDTAMSTSGDYERYYDEKGVRYHHIIDPHTGHSARRVRSATIIAPTALQTDGLSKTAFVIGAEAALQIINGLPGVDAIFVKPDGRVLYSNGLQPGDKLKP